LWGVRFKSSVFRRDIGFLHRGKAQALPIGAKTLPLGFLGIGSKIERQTGRVILWNLFHTGPKSQPNEPEKEKKGSEPFGKIERGWERKSWVIFATAWHIGKERSVNEKDSQRRLLESERLYASSHAGADPYAKI